MSPYVVTTKRPKTPHSSQLDNPSTAYAVTRRAVATLDEAREVTAEIVRHVRDHDANPATTYPAGRAILASLPESGGTVGPLPDGTVIEVAPATTLDIAARAGVTNGQGTAEVIDAFNAQETRA